MREHKPDSGEVSPKKGPRRSLVGQRPGDDFLVVGIGASAGGLEAVSHLLHQLPGDLGLAIVVVQHLDPTHDSALAELLARVSRLAVHEATDGMPLKPDHVYVSPPNASMVLSRGSLRLTPRAEAADPHRPIDLFLHSLAEEKLGKAIGVVLSGTGSDGTHGLEAIRAEGGITFAQDATATYPGMPTNAVDAGCVDYVLPPEAIAKELARISRHPTVSGGPFADVQPPEGDVEDPFDSVVRRLSQVSGVDFSNYKQPTLRRRIHRRMVIRRAERVEDYAQVLQEDPDEAERLCRDVLINVTRFFRDSEVFDALKEKVFPAVLQKRPSDRPVRVWVPGCATGEEVYSLAICILEFLGRRAEVTPIKLFGTDVVESVIRQARSGRYPEHIAADIGAGRLRRFFVNTDDGYVVSKAVRDLCVFARQDATRDPPFSNLDLISCRNLLIYLGPALQKRILPFFHYALREGGFLLLGPSETVSQASELFSAVDRKRRIYARRPIPTRLLFDLAADRSGRAADSGITTLPPVLREVDVLREADRVLLARYAPAGVLIDERLEILQFRGATGVFLEPAPGAPTSNLRGMARRGLFPQLSDAVEEAKGRGSPVVKQGLRVKSDGATIDVSIEVIPVLPPTSSKPCFLVLFDAANAERAAARRADLPAEQDGSAAAVERRRSEDLERELAAAKDYLRASVEEREVVTEELRAANEELLSGNEELQSTNEELQTAQEELQATNEELLTVNEELQHRNEEATLLGDDLTNLLASVEIPIIMLGRDLGIRRFTPSAGELLHLIPSDVGRPILDLNLKVDVPDLEVLLLEVLDTLAFKQRDVRDTEGRWHSLCVRPYRSQADKIDGVVIILTDVDAVKRSAQRLAAARDSADSIVMTVREPLLVLDEEMRVERANDACRVAFGTVPTGIAASESDSAEGEWYIAGLREKLESARDGGGDFEGFVSETDLPGMGRRVLRTNARRIHGGDDNKRTILLAVEDVTDQRRAAAEKKALTEKLREAQRIKSLGVLAGGIAHDFNNILTAILGYAELVQLKLTPASPLLPPMRDIEQGALRAAELCQQMLAYAGKGPLVVKQLDLSALVTDFGQLLRASISKKATLRLELDDHLPSIVGDVAQLHQVVMNLVINASEALEQEVGTITVRTGRIRPDRAYFASARVCPERLRESYVYLEVTDDGCGMGAETEAQIFDPFFSLKFLGRGLGLAAVIGIVQRHDGALTVDSEPNRGSTFRILFPEAGGPAERPSRAIDPVAVDTAWRGQGTVLIVDDESIVRGVLKGMLERLGFRVEEAEHGLAGVEAFREMSAVIDLVLLDVSMPVLDGPEAFRKIREIRSDVRIILMSGYNKSPQLDEVVAGGLAGFLRKPFLFRDLVSTLKCVFEDE